MNYLRKNIVERDFNKIIDFKDKELINEVDNEKILLSNAIKDNLILSLIEQDCSNGSAKVYDWLLNDYIDAVCEEDLVRLTEKQYNKKGELEYNNNYNFENEVY